MNQRHVPLEEKYFTREEANRLLPTLRPLLEEFLATQEEHAKVQEEYNTLYFKVANNGQNFESDALVKLKQKLEDIEKKMEALGEQIEEIGCVLKGVDPPLLDFPTRIDGQEAYLCWRLDEDEIRYWHDLQSGYAGRQPLMNM